MASQAICKIEGCGKRVMAFGWCNRHYQRWRAHGDPLAGGSEQTPRGEPGRYFQETVLSYTGDDCLIWPYGKISTGYGTLHLGGGRGARPHLVHRLACEAVYGPPPTPDHEAAHSCGNGKGGCCNPRHLRWATHTENMADKLADGTTNRGERQGLSKLTEADVREIRSLKGKMPYGAIAVRFNIDPSSVSDILLGRTWSWLA